MVIKSLSRRTSTGTARLIKYIFKEQAAIKELKEKVERSYYLPGITFTEKDLQYLKVERAEAALITELKEKFNGDIRAFIESQINKQTPCIIKHNIRSRSINGYIKEFEKNEAGRLYTRKDQVAAYHTILSWSPEDARHLTNKALTDIAKEYIRLRGNNNIYIGTVHREKDHVHLHIAISGTQLNGRSSRITRDQFREIKIQIQEYQKLKYPQLVSLPEHGKNKSNEKVKEAVYKNIKNERSLVKTDLVQCLDEVYRQSRSTQEFLSELKARSIQSYERSGKLTGVTFNDIKFRFSRLGYDLEKFKHLDAQKEKEDKVLSDIRQIRESKTKILDKDIRPKDSKEPDNDKEREALQELSNLRGEHECEVERADNENEPSQNDGEVSGTEENESEAKNDALNEIGESDEDETEDMKDVEGDENLETD